MPLARSAPLISFPSHVFSYGLGFISHRGSAGANIDQIGGIFCDYISSTNYDIAWGIKKEKFGGCYCSLFVHFY